MEEYNTKNANILVVNASIEHIKYAENICALIETAAKERGTGIAKRTPEYVEKKINEGKSVIALTEKGELAGYCYIETWDHGKYIANSGLIVAPEFRKIGLAKRIKKAAFDLSREKYPDAKLFGITTSSAVLKINSILGYRPVAFAELTKDEAFWKGCQSCRNFDILTRTNRNFCLCTGMLMDPNEKLESIKAEEEDEEAKSSAGL